MIELAPLLLPALVGVVLGIQRLAPKGTRRTNPPGRVATLVMVAVLFGVGLAVRAGFNDTFYAYAISGDSLSLVYLWPTSPVVVAPTSLGVVRYRTWDKYGEQARWRVDLRAGSSEYRSCATGILTEIAAAAKAMATSARRTAEWSVQCPSGRVVPSTEQVVSAPGKLAIPAACRATAPGP